jgi:two-component system nitrate/nitrite response regulator NarL
MRVLLVEDHQVLRAGLRILCERRAQWRVVGEASDCATALSLVKQEQPDILLLDLTLADGSAINCLPRLREMFEGGIVILTAEEDPHVHRQACEQGADAVVLKGAEFEDLFAEVKRVALQKNVSTPSSTSACAPAPNSTSPSASIRAVA